MEMTEEIIGELEEVFETAADILIEKSEADPLIYEYLEEVRLKIMDLRLYCENFEMRNEQFNNSQNPERTASEIMLI